MLKDRARKWIEDHRIARIVFTDKDGKVRVVDVRKREDSLRKRK